MINPEFIKLVQCSTCGKEVAPELFYKTIVRTHLDFCSQKCLDICCSVIKIQAGVFIIGSSFIVSLWLGPIMIPFILVGAFILYCGLVGSKKCVFAQQFTAQNEIETGVEEIDLSEFGKI